MPKKTAYRSGAQRNKTKQKSFELVRPVSDENVLETVESDEVEEVEEDVVGEMTSTESEDGEEVEEVREVKTKGGNTGIKVGASAAAVISTTPATGNGSSPKSAAARLAARRLAAQKAQRTSSNLITAEHYSYVRKDLIFILILAIIMFGTIIALHFVLGS